MSDSGDSSDSVNQRPSGKICRLRSDQQKKKRRIVMRIEFDDSDEETTTTTSSSSSDDERPSCSNRNRQRSACVAKKEPSSKIKPTANMQSNGVDHALSLEDDTTDDLSVSEINQPLKLHRNVSRKKRIVSEDVCTIGTTQSPQKHSKSPSKEDEAEGFTSDSSSNELLEKCPICLLTFRQQEIGSPSTCAHIFCANCIEAWSKNVQTCPIDRIEFEKIIVRESYEKRNILREIHVEKDKNCKDNLHSGDGDYNEVITVDDEEDATNCEICNSPEREDVMLLCDSCNQGYHIDCLIPPLPSIPEGSWYCDNCFDSEDPSDTDEVEEDLHLLYEDIRGMGIPPAQLRVTEVRQPRILRTRQNERIRAAILRHTRSAAARANSTITTTTTGTAAAAAGTSRRRVSSRRTTAATTTTAAFSANVTRKIKRKSARKPQRGRRRRSRRVRQRTYVVEYDLNNFDKKFAIKTTKKVIRRRRRRKRRSVQKATPQNSSATGRRSASQRLAEQMGVRRERTYIKPTHTAGTSALSLFGNANDLEYFSDDDGGGMGDEEVRFEAGLGTAVQTSVRLSNLGSLRSRKGLLLGRLLGNKSSSSATESNAPAADVSSAPLDILSNILDMQDRWHSASRNLESVRINTDGTLQLPAGESKANAPTQSAAPEQRVQTTSEIEVTQAPRYSQGSGGNQSFNAGGNRYGNSGYNSQNNQRAGGGSNQYRHSTGGGMGGGLAGNFSMVGRGNFSFSNPDYNPNQNSSFAPFNNLDRERERERERFLNQRNRQQGVNNTNHRNSFPFNTRPPQHQPREEVAQLFAGLPPPVSGQSQHSQSMQQCPLPQTNNDRALFSGLPPPVATQLPPPISASLAPSTEQHLFGTLPPPVMQQRHIPPPPPPISTNEQQQIFALPPPQANFGPQLPQTHSHQQQQQQQKQPQQQQQQLQSSSLPNMSVPPPIVGPVARTAVPPPPAPPAALTNWNSSLFSYAQDDDDDDDSNCPNFSVYSVESQEVAKASETKKNTNEDDLPKEDDENEDLVQLDDDDDITMPPQNNRSQNSELYEPENPTDEVENEIGNDNVSESNILNSKTTELAGKNVYEKQKTTADDETKVNDDDDDDQYDPEQETGTIDSISTGEKDLEEDDALSDNTPEKENVSPIDEKQLDEQIGIQEEAEVEEKQKQEKEKEAERRQNEKHDDERDEEDGSKRDKKEEKEKLGETDVVNMTRGTESVENTNRTTLDDENEQNERPNMTEKHSKNSDSGDVCTPSPIRTPARTKKAQADADIASANRKGVLELYDDSDWDELDIDRPRSTERMDGVIRGRTEETVKNKSNRSKEAENEQQTGKEEEEEEQDRSYTPCLDEKNDPEDEPEATTNDNASGGGGGDGGGTPEIPIADFAKIPEDNAKNSSVTNEEVGLLNEPPEVVNIVEREIVSDDENMERHEIGRRRKDRHTKRGPERAETFKKVSSRRKERNYRTEKADKQKNRTREERSPLSRSLTRSRSRSRSHSRSVSHSRSRTRTRSRLRSRSRSPSRVRSLSRARLQREEPTYRNRRRRLSRSPVLRPSRSRSNDKENHFNAHGYNQGYNQGRFNRGNSNNRVYNNNNNNNNNRFNSKFNQRPRRRELPRYDVRNVVGNVRGFNAKDRYGRDTSRPPHRNSRSLSRTRRRRSYSAVSRSRSFSVSPKRLRRSSFSISPSPSSPQRLRRPLRRGSFSPPRPQPAVSIRRSPAGNVYRRKSPSRTPPRARRSRTVSPLPRKSRAVKRHAPAAAECSPQIMQRKSLSPLSGSPRYTPRLSQSRSQSPRSKPKNKRKKLKDRKKKKTKKRIIASKSPEPMCRSSRQRDQFEHDLLTAAAATSSKRKRRHSPPEALSLSNIISTSPRVDETAWSPSPSPPPIREYDNNVSWTPPLMSSQAELGEDSIFPDMYTAPPDSRHEVLKPAGGKKDKRKREKKKKKSEKRRDGGSRKDKRRAFRGTETPELTASKEVFASGNNILVSVSFNKDVNAAAAGHVPQQTTVVTLPPTREDVVSAIRRGSTERQVTAIGPKRKRDRNHKRKKLDTKPVAIIDLERSPFQVHQEPADIIVLTDSDGANGGDDEQDDRIEHHHSEHEHRLSEPKENDVEHHHRARVGSSSGGGCGGQTGSHQDQQTPPLLGAIIEEESSYELQQTGPKTPPEPPVIKFTLLNKQKSKLRNVLHDATEHVSHSTEDLLEMEEEEMEEEQLQQQQHHHQDMEIGQSTQKIGPNTPPESGPCSPDVYDPFDPTKSPSLSPRSPTPPPLLLDKSQSSLADDSGSDGAEKHSADEMNRQAVERITQQQISAGNTGAASQSSAATTLNPVELVMALMNSKQQASATQDLSNKTMDSQYTSSSSHLLSNSSVSLDETHAGGSGSGIQDNSDDIATGGSSAGITVLSNLLISSAKHSQHIPTISSPTPPMPTTKSSHNMISKLPLPKVVTGSSGGGGSGGSGGSGLPNSLRNGGAAADDSFNDIESPYSPGSADYEDLFEPPPDNTSNSKRRTKSSGREKFDNLFGSSSPIGHVRLPSYVPSTKKYKPQPMLPGTASRKLKVAKVGKSGEEHIKVYDEVPNSAVELQVKDKFLRKLNRQERVVEEVKMVLKPRFNKKQISKDDYKEIMRRAVPKICHSRSGEINPNKIKILIEAYVKKFRAKHKKLNLINTGQVSSAVKCAAYLKKL